MSIQSRAIAAANAISSRVKGEPVTFIRGDLTIEFPLAVRGSTNWDRDATYPGNRIGDKSTDWLIPAALLVDDDGTQLEPAVDDVFISDAGSFTVMPFGPNRQVWQWHDREGRTWYRVHTKERP